MRMFRLFVKKCTIIDRPIQQWNKLEPHKEKGGKNTERHVKEQSKQGIYGLPTIRKSIIVILSMYRKGGIVAW